MSLFSESRIVIPDSLRDGETVGVGLSSWVHRLDAVAKVYTSNCEKDRDREIAVYGRLQPDMGSWHPAILRYYGVLEGYVVVVQFASNGTIRQYLSRDDREPPPLPVRLRWAEQATDAIAYVHSKRVLHSDISANNIFLDDNLNAMVGDFAASTIDDKPCLGLYETSHSHPDTQSPSEQSEIFALGSTFYEILVGEKPFEGRDVIEIEKSFRQGQFPSLEALPAFQDIISKCWTAQYGTVASLLDDVKEEGSVFQEYLLNLG